MKNLFFLLLFFVFSSSLSAQSEWETLSPKPTINNLISDYFVSDQVGWVTGVNGTILHTTDGGTTWETQNSNPDQSFWSIFFIDDNEGWAVGWSTILHTTDAGQTWEKQIKPSYPADMTDVFFINHDTGWIVGTYKFILKTTDGGNTWVKKMHSFYQSYALWSVDFTDALHGCAVGGKFGGDDIGLILTTNDGGETWSDQTPENTNVFNSVTFLSPDTGWVCGRHGQIMKTTDGGNSWTNHNVNMFDAYNDIHFFNSQHGVLLMHNQTRQTFDGGQTWDSLSYISSSSAFRSFTGCGNNALMAVGYYGSISKSLDGGSTWVAVNNGNNYPFKNIGFFDANNGLSIAGYTYSSSVLLRSSDGGNTWFDDTIVDNGPFYKMQVLGQNCFLLNDSSQLVKSADGGQTWTTTNILSGTSNYYYDMQFTDGLNGYLCSDSSVLVKTTDGGASWQSVNFTDNYQFRNLFFLNDNLGWLIDIDSKTILRTKTGGNDWYFSQLTEDGYVFNPVDIFFVNSDTGYVSTSEGVMFKTTNGGNSWQEFYTFGGTSSSMIWFVNDQEGWYSNTGSIYHTYDGGQTWINRESFGSDHIKDLFFFDNGQGWLCGYYGLVAWHSSWVNIIEHQNPVALVTVFPNPANSFITVDINNSQQIINTIEVFNMSGQRVINIEGLTTTGSYKLDINKLQPGTYIVKVSTPSDKRLAKFVVQ